MKIIITLFLAMFLCFESLSQYWVEQTSGVNVRLNSVSTSNYSIIWICGNAGTVLRTTNNGTNWINISGGGLPNNINLVSIKSIDANTALTTGKIDSVTYVYKTTNAGTSWQQVFSQNNGFINAIGKLTGNILFMSGNPVGGRWSLWKSSNNGSNWDSTGLYLQQAGNETGFSNSMYCSMSDKIWIGTNNSRVYYSSNNGSVWSMQSLGFETNCSAIHIDDDYTFYKGFAGGEGLLKTTNGGQTWQYQSAPGIGSFGGITGESAIISGPNNLWTVYYVRSDNKIYLGTSSNNYNFQVNYTAPSGIYTYVGGNTNLGPFWALRDNGGISFRVSQSGLINLNTEIPSMFELDQNYPNPFNPSTTIAFDLPEKSYVILKVYNLLGKEISLLINESLAAGSYEYNWNAENLSSGIYYYSIETGNFRNTKKMVLIK